MTRWARAAIYAALSVEIGLLVWYAATHNPFDLNVYLWGGHAVTHDSRLYLARVDWQWFTYPPFAAVVFLPLAAMPVVMARVIWELASVAALTWACITTVKLAGYRASRTVIAAVVVIAIGLEPVYLTLYFGQVNLFLLALVLIDVWRAAQRRPAGIGVGLAAAVKLTPAIFIILFLLTRRTRTAMTAAGTFVCCGLIGYLVAPAASRLYWSRLFYDTTRVTAAYIGNQSPYGTAARILGGVGHVGAWYPLVPLTIGAAGLVIATLLARHDDWLAAAAVTGVTGLLVSPVSWTHHWVWVIPALFVLVRGGTGSRVAAACGYLLFALAPLWWTPHSDYQNEYGLHGLLTLVANCYLVAGLAFLAYMALRIYQIYRQDRRSLAAIEHRPATAHHARTPAPNP